MRFYRDDLLATSALPLYPCAFILYPFPVPLPFPKGIPDSARGAAAEPDSLQASPLAPGPYAPDNPPPPPQTVPQKISDALALFLSAVLSPYIVIPVGTLYLVWARSREQPEQFWPWLGVSLFFSTILPVLFIIYGIWRGTITDIHVMERTQRGGPFVVAIVGSLVAAFALHWMGAPRSVWALSAILAVNGLAMLFITNYTKISIHVAVLSATVLGASMLEPKLNGKLLLVLIPLLMWGRWRRGRHTWIQGIQGCLVACLLTAGTIYSIDGLAQRLHQFVERMTGA